MRLYIVRHGKATDAQPANPRAFTQREAAADPDFVRELTPRGEAQATFLGSRLRQVDVRPSLILASKYARAKRTAEICQQALGCELRFDEGLEVDHDVAEALALIDENREAAGQALMVVGHNPQLGELLSVLASGLPPQDMILKTGELIALEVRPSQLIGSAKIVGRLRMSDERPDDTIVGGVFGDAKAGAL